VDDGVSELFQRSSELAATTYHKSALQFHGYFPYYINMALNVFPFLETSLILIS